MLINNREYDPEIPEDRREIIQFIKGYRAMEYPSITEMLIGRTRMFDTKRNIAFTMLNLKTAFYELYLNFSEIKAKNYDFNFVEFLTWHELVHNFLRHLTREKIIQYSKINKELVNIILDTVVNEYLTQKMNMLEPHNKPLLNWNYEILTTSFSDVEFDFKKDEIVSVDHLIDLFQKYFDSSDGGAGKTAIAIKKAQSRGGGAGQELDNHEQSMAGNGAGGQENEEVGEGDESPNSNMTPEELKAHKIPDFNEADIDEMAKRVIEEMIESSKMRGTKCTDVESRLFELAVLKENQFDFIKLKNVIKNAYGGSWSRTYKTIHKHKEYFTGVPYKGRQRTKPKRAIFAIDTSGSVGTKELNYMLSTLYTYCKKNKEGVIVDLIAWSSSLDNHYRNISDYKEIPKVKMGSTGGTEIHYLWDHLAKEFPDEKLTVIVITDGYISGHKYNKDVINDLYFGLTENTEKDVRSMYPDSKIVRLKYEK